MFEPIPKDSSFGTAFAQVLVEVDVGKERHTILECALAHLITHDRTTQHETIKGSG